MYRVEFTEDEFALLRAALAAYLEEFGHEEADAVRQIKRLQEKLTVATAT